MVTINIGQFVLAMIGSILLPIGIGMIVFGIIDYLTHRNGVAHG